MGPISKSDLLFFLDIFCMVCGLVMFAVGLKIQEREVYRIGGGLFVWSLIGLAWIERK